jgi:AcrR family transcriptional regulator
MSSERPADLRGEDALRAFWSGLDLLWDAAAAPPAAPRRGLGSDEIVRAAIELADADGLEAVTMRRVAARLGSGAMSLYRHVPDKDALVLLMIDAALLEAHELQPMLPEGDWRAALRALAETNWTLMRRHRWLPEAMLVRPPLTPNGVAGLEWALSIFDPFALPIGDKMELVTAVHFTVLSAALNAAIEDRTRERLRMSDEQILSSSSFVIEKIAAGGEFRRVMEFIVEAEHLDETTQMRRAVELVLDGIATRLAAAGPAA